MSPGTRCQSEALLLVEPGQSISRSAELSHLMGRWHGHGEVWPHDVDKALTHSQPLGGNHRVALAGGCNDGGRHALDVPLPHCRAAAFQGHPQELEGLYPQLRAVAAVILHTAKQQWNEMISPSQNSATKKVKN